MRFSRAVSVRSLPIICKSLSICRELLVGFISEMECEPNILDSECSFEHSSLNFVFSFGGISFLTTIQLGKASYPGYIRRIVSSVTFCDDDSTVKLHHESRLNPYLLAAPVRYVIFLSCGRTHLDFGVESSLQLSAMSFYSALLCNPLLTRVANREEV